MRSSLAMVVLTALVSSCVHRRHQPEPEYFCRAPVKPIPPPRAPGTQIPGGKLEVKAIGSASSALRERHLSIHAEGVPISLLGPRVGAALGAPVAVSQQALDYVVSLHFDDVTVEAFGYALRRAASVNFDIVHDAIWIESPRDVADRYDAHDDPPPIMVQLYPLKRSHIAGQLVELICKSMLTRHGFITVVGQSLVVGDFAENQSRIRATVEALDVEAVSPKRAAQRDADGVDALDADAPPPKPDAPRDAGES